MSYEPMDYMDVEVVQEKATPVQNVFFFKKGISGHDIVLFILLGWIQNIKFPFKVHSGRWVKTKTKNYIKL